MSVKDAVQRHGNWLPDLFTALWKLLDPKTLVASIPDFREVEKLAKIVKQSPGTSLPKALQELLLSGAPETLQKRLCVVMLAIDTAFHDIYPWTKTTTGRLSGGLSAFLTHFEEKGRYDLGEHGEFLLIPMSRSRRAENVLRPADKRPFLSRQDAMFQNLLLTPTGCESCWYSFERLSAWKAFDVDDPVVGLCPLVEQSSEASIVPVVPADGGTKLQFTVNISDAQEATLADRAALIIAEMEAAGVHVAVFPELVVTAKVRKAISDTLQAAAKLGTPNLQFVVAGSGKTHVKGDSLPLNECHVFGSRGEELFRQAKINHFSMRGKDAKAFCRLDCLEEPERGQAKLALSEVGDDELLPEAMRAGSSLTVFDSALGRLIVLICEDLAAPRPSALICDQAFPDWVVSPVMDRSIFAKRWHLRMSDRASTLGGSRVIVANSLLLEKLSPSETMRIGYGMIVNQPHPWEPIVIEVDRVHGDGEWWPGPSSAARKA